MRTSPLLADFIQARGCKPICEKYLTLPFCYENVTLKRAQNTSHLSAGRLRYEIAHSGRAWYGIRFPPK